MVRNLRVVYIEDCVHVIHVYNLWNYLEYTLKPESLPEFIVLTRSSQRVRESCAAVIFCLAQSRHLTFSWQQMASSTEREKVLSSCRALKTKIFKAFLPTADGVQQKIADCALLPRLKEDILLSDLQDTEVDVLLPTANGWLLGYPVVYTFSKREAAEAGRRLAMTDLHLFKVSLQR